MRVQHGRVDERQVHRRELVQALGLENLDVIPCERIRSARHHSESGARPSFGSGGLADGRSPHINTPEHTTARHTSRFNAVRISNPRIWE